jgi:hypothetical protein
VLSAVRAELVSELRIRGRAGGIELDDGRDLLAPLGVRDPDDAAVRDRGVLEQRGLDLRGVHVDAPADDHVRSPVAEIEIARGIQVADVAEGEEISAATLGRLLRVALVLEARARPEVDVARHTGGAGAAVGVEDVHLEARPGPADGAGVREPLLGGDADAAPLGSAVELEEDRAEPVDHAPLHVDRHRRRSVHDEAQAREVEALARRLVQAQQPDEVGGDEEGRDDPLALDGAQELALAPALEQHDVGSEQDRTLAVGVRARVVERRRDEVWPARGRARGAFQHRAARLAGEPRRGLRRARRA